MSRFTLFLKESSRAGTVMVVILGSMVATGYLATAINPDLDPRSAVAGTVLWALLWTLLGSVFGLTLRIDRWVFKERNAAEAKPDQTSEFHHW